MNFAEMINSAAAYLGEDGVTARMILEEYARRLWPTTDRFTPSHSRELAYLAAEVMVGDRGKIYT